MKRILILILLLAVSACVKKVKMDDKLTCQDIISEIIEIQRIQNPVPEIQERLANLRDLYKYRQCGLIQQR